MVVVVVVQLPLWLLLEAEFATFFHGRAAAAAAAVKFLLELPCLLKIMTLKMTNRWHCHKYLLLIQTKMLLAVNKSM
jgi:hypothetical protein